METIFDKIWKKHTVGEGLLYIDLHLIHEVTSPQAFAGLAENDRTVRRPDKTLATVDHNVPTNHPRSVADIKQILSRKQVERLEENCRAYGIPLLSVDSDKRGIVHMIGPELGLTQPGMTIVCGDSHTSTHGAFGALAFGIGTSEVEHVLATQTLVAQKPKQMRINYIGEKPEAVTAKDIILYTIGQLGASGMTGYLVEYAGVAIQKLSMEERMTICNMSIEGGAKAGTVAADNKTIDYLKGIIPVDSAKKQAWLEFHSDSEAIFDREETIDISEISPMITWGTTPAMVAPANGTIPEPRDSSQARAQKYMQVRPGQRLADILVDEVFIGSCTNSRISDLRAAAAVIKQYGGKAVIKSRVVPGSESVRRQAEQEGIADVFKAAGFEWASAGCSSCLGMMDSLDAVRVASTSNRNFEGRQGKGTRSHLMSPAAAARVAMTGKLGISESLA